jgi:uncharacterized Zn finger protein (UPF0148 family)
MASTTTNAAPKDPAAEKRERIRTETASIIIGVKQAILPDEQLLGFTRGRIAGGWRGKLNIGPEAFFAPFVNIALTDRRILLQHIHPETGAPSEIMPHVFELKDVHDVQFGDIEAFGGDPAGRIVLSLNEEQRFRIRVSGMAAFESARNLAEVYRAYTHSRHEHRTASTADHCARCHTRLDEPVKFCPYCGNRTSTAETAQDATPEPEPDRTEHETCIDDILDSLESNAYEEPASAPLSDAIAEDAAAESSNGTSSTTEGAE